MTVRELVEKLQKVPQDLEVSVRVTKCVSPAEGETVISLHQGFDWTAGRLMLCTASPLIREQDTCRKCGMYGVGAAKDISSRCYFTNMDTGDMEVAVYNGKRKMFAIPFNVRGAKE